MHTAVAPVINKDTPSLVHVLASHLAAVVQALQVGADVVLPMRDALADAALPVAGVRHCRCGEVFVSLLRIASIGHSVDRGSKTY